MQGSSYGEDIEKVDKIMVKRRKRGPHGKLGLGKSRMRIKQSRKFGYEKKGLDKGSKKRFWDEKSESQRKRKMGRGTIVVALTF